MKKARIITLLSLTALTLLASCSNTSDSSSSSVVPEEEETDTIEGTVHEVKVTDRPDRVFTKEENGIRVTDYKIIYDSSYDYVTTAATYISSNLYNASGAEFVAQSEEDFFAEGGTVSASSKLIIVGCSDLFTGAGLTYPERVRISGGYYIKNVRNAFYIQASELYGYHLAALTFLRKTVDFDMIMEDTIVYENKNIDTLPDMDIVERSDFETNTVSNYSTTTTKYGLGYLTSYPFMLPVRPDGKTGVVWHNVFDYVPREMYQEEHQNWYSTGAHTQLCYSAHGDASEYQALVEAVGEVVCNTVDAYPDRTLLNITSNDIGSACECDECLRLKAQDGAYSGQVIRFMNDVDDIMQEHLRKTAEENNTAKRTVHLQFFSYLAYADAPTTSIEDDPSLKCNDEVMVCCAPLHANYTKTFYDEVNEDYARTFTEWNKYCSNICAWLYSTNYHHYMYPYNTYASMMKNYRYCRENGTKVMLDEGQRYSSNVTCFGKLKEYLVTKCLFDATSNYNYYTDKFFRNQYLEAADLMREYYEEMIAWETKLENDPSTGLGGGVYEEIGSTASFWPKQLLLNWLDKMDQAEKAISKYEATDNALYKRLVKHINIERLFPLFCLCDKHADSYTEDEILALRLHFKELADELGLIEFAEHDSNISVKYAEWGIN